jgi:hypothetical protein
MALFDIAEKYWKELQGIGNITHSTSIECNEYWQKLAKLHIYIKTVFRYSKCVIVRGMS